MADSVSLHVRTGTGWLVGFRTMAQKEWGSWWRTRRAVVHLTLWLFVINGLLFLVGVDERGSKAPIVIVNELVEVFFQACGLFAAIGIVVSTQSMILGEKQLGTAEWVLSKPITRSAFVLSKLLVNGTSFVILAVLVPSVVLYLQSIHHAYTQPELVPFLTATLLHLLHLLFYLTLSLLCGTYFRGRGAVSGLAIGFLIGGLIMLSVIPSIAMYLPWVLLPMASEIGKGQPFPDGGWIPVVVTALSALLFVLVGLRRFDREEF